MANLSSPDTQAKIVSDAAQDFVEQYYESLNRRHSLAPYYASASARLTSASVRPDISINGQVLESVAAYEALLDAQGRHVRYEVASFDAHPVNPNYTLGCPDNAADGSDAGRGRVTRSVREGERLSFAVQVGGTIRYGQQSGSANGGNNTSSAAAPAGATGTAENGGGQPETAFNEAWLLVPHWEAMGRNAPRGLKKWVAISQNFRAF